MLPLYLLTPQVVGHMFALPIVFDLVAKTGEEKSEVYALIDNIVGK